MGVEGKVGVSVRIAVETARLAKRFQSPEFREVVERATTEKEGKRMAKQR